MTDTFNPSILVRLAEGIETLGLEQDEIVVLANHSGRYHRLRGASAELLRVLAERGGQESLGMLPAELVVALSRLEAAGLAIREPLEGRPIIPRLCVEYALWNWTLQLAVRLLGWQLIGRFRRSSPSGSGSPPHPRMVDDLIAAARRASSWPRVSTQCTITAMSLSAMLRRRGQPAIVVVGGQTDAFEPHAWVEVRGRRVDPSGLTAYLVPFEPLVV